MKKKEKTKPMSWKKRGLLLMAAGMLCLAGCLVLLLTTESVFSTVLFYFSIGLNIIGLYILLWVKDGGKKHDEK